MFESSDLEIMLDKAGFVFKRVGDSIWQVAVPSDNVHNLIVSLQDSLLLIRLKLLALKGEEDTEFFKKLLKLNATAITHGAFALEQDKVILIDSLETENLDQNELTASIQSISFTARESFKELSAS